MPDKTTSLETALAKYKQRNEPYTMQSIEEEAFRAGYSACLSDFVRHSYDAKAKRGAVSANNV